MECSKINTALNEIWFCIMEGRRAIKALEAACRNLTERRMV